MYIYLNVVDNYKITSQTNVDTKLDDKTLLTAFSAC